MSVLLGNGDGSFQTAVSFAACDLPISVAGADLDGDTVLDLVTVNSGPGITEFRHVSVLLDNGDGSFQAPSIRGPGLTMNLRATHYSGCTGQLGSVASFRTGLHIKADEAGRLQPNGTRTPFFTQRGDASCTLCSCFGYFSSGTFIVGREVLTSVPALLPGARVVLVLALGLSVPCWNLLRRR